MSTSPIQREMIPSVVAFAICERYRASLSEHDFVLLTLVLTEPLEYVPHSIFARHDIETFLFGKPSILPAGATRFEEFSVMNDLEFDAITEETTLKSAQEVFLFQRYNYARLRIFYLLEGIDTEVSFDTIRKIVAWTQRAMNARGHLSRSNLPLVLAMLKRTRINGLDTNELISEGNYALLRSVDKFDCSRGFKFSTYACRAILKSFSRIAIRTSRYRLQFPMEFDPTLEKSDFTDRKRDNLEGQCVEEVRDILDHNRAGLNDVERLVIRERFALDTVTLPAQPKTLEEIGEMLGVTKERVRQIQNKALQKIRVLLEATLVA